MIKFTVPQEYIIHTRQRGDLVVDDVVETLVLISIAPGITTKEIGLKLSISQWTGSVHPTGVEVF